MDDPQVIDAFLDEGSAAVDDVAAALADCRFESRAFGEIDPAGCASLLPTLVLVDATGAAGVAFLGDLDLDPDHVAGAPIVALTTDGEVRAGVDATVDVTAPAEAWVRMVQDLLR
ncbi:MAG: hypothetical protein H0T70_01320 [Acidimicrobiia bacterium]|nr:hypothetical protein [Acidimicrobiia bacterium]